MKSRNRITSSALLILVYMNLQKNQEPNGLPDWLLSADDSHMIFRTRFSLSKDPNSGPITRTHQTLFTPKPKIQGIQTPVKERKVYNIEKMVFEYDSSSVKIIKCNIFCNGLLFCLLQKESGVVNLKAFSTKTHS